DVPFLAKGQSTDQLPFGTYVIQQSAVPATLSDDFTLIAVTCNGKLEPFAQGRVRVRVTRDAPPQPCTFLNRPCPAAAPPAPHAHPAAGPRAGRRAPPPRAHQAPSERVGRAIHDPDVPAAGHQPRDRDRYPSRRGRQAG